MKKTKEYWKREEEKLERDLAAAIASGRVRGMRIG
jgi:hypothetical protein